MKSRQVILSPEAQDDLSALHDQFADAASERTALGYLSRLETYLSGFDIASERGSARDDLRDGLRMIGFEKRITVAFSVTDDEVTILRIFYGGQDWSSAF